MGNTTKLGKVVADVLGYKVRIILESKTVEKTSREGKAVRNTFLADSGKYGVYAGKKKLIQGDFKTKDEAIEYALSIKPKK